MSVLVKRGPAAVPGLCLTVGAFVLPADADSSGASPTTSIQASARVSGGAVTLVDIPKDLTLGDRFTVTAKVSRARLAKTVQIQTQTLDYYGNKQWTSTKTSRVKGAARHTFNLVASGVDRQKIRALVTYRDGAQVASKSVGYTIWQWTNLSSFSSYYRTGGVMDYSWSQFGMNGDQYVGWYTLGGYDMWEARYTPGRNCKAFRGVFGVTDDSADGSSAEFTLVTDETTTVYQSPSLVPGSVETVQLDLAKPYRFAIQARNTSPDGVWSYPAIGNPQFLCTGL